MNTLTLLIDFIAGMFLIAFLDGALGIGFGEAFYILSGFLQMIAIIWALKIVHSNETQ